MLENVTIRKLSAADTDEIIRIYKSITLQSGDIDIEEVVADRAYRNTDACFVAEHQGRLVGFIVSYQMTGSFGIQQSAWIPTFGVDPDFMGRGIGKRLAEAVFNYYKAKGVQNVYTSVRWYDTDVLSFLRTIGFDRSEFINLQKRLE
ncbi:MAG: GNAT family N-acetyltransferase [Desulfobacteraceae bacterium]